MSQYFLPGQELFDTTSNSAQSQRTLIAPTASGGLTDLILKWPGFSENIPEVDLPQQYTVTSVLEYPMGTLSYRFYGQNGNTTLTVLPGRALVETMPCPIFIAPGAMFRIHSWINWTMGSFPLCTRISCVAATDRFVRGTNLPDITQSIMTLTNASFYGFGCGVYGTFSNPTPVIANLGDSTTVGVEDAPSDIDGQPYIQRAMRNVFPVINLGKASDGVEGYMTRPDGRVSLFRKSITHLIYGFGRNSISSVTDNSAVEFQNFLNVAEFYQNAGVKVIPVTVTPDTASVNRWLSPSDQTQVSGVPTYVLRYNNLLRAGASTYGYGAPIDAALAMDPAEIGVWRTDGSILTGGTCAGFATLSGGTIASVRAAQYPTGMSPGSSKGSGFSTTSGTVVPMTVTPYPGDTGSGAVVHGVTDGAGEINTWVVDSPGSGYSYPPMIYPTGGARTFSGIHGNGKGNSEIIALTGLGPAMFMN